MATEAQKGRAEAEIPAVRWPAGTKPTLSRCGRRSAPTNKTSELSRRGMTHNAGFADPKGRETENVCAAEEKIHKKKKNTTKKMNVASAELLAACVLNEETVLLLLQICVRGGGCCWEAEGGRHQGQRNPYDVCV
jgi:hypothetical protein